MKLRYWRYLALTANGQETSGIFEGDRDELRSFVDQHNLEMIHIDVDWRSFFFKSQKIKRLSLKVLSTFFEDLANMQQTGISMSQMFVSIADCSTNAALTHTIGLIKVNVEQGQSLAEAFSSSKTFPWIVIATINSGEQSGKLESSFRVLAHFFRRQDEVIGRLREAMVYPAIVSILLITVMLFVGLKVIPQLKQLLPETAMHKGTTGFVIAMSVFLQKYFLVLLYLPCILFLAGALILLHNKQLYASLIYQVPFYGPMKKETDLAFYFLNLSILLGNGVPLIRCISDMNTLNESNVSRHFHGCKDYLFGGMPLWESLRMDPFFSSVVVFTVRRGEEMARLPEYCSNLSDYFNKRVYERIDRAVLLIQPALLAMGGIFLVIIAFAFLIPVYGSLNQIAGG